MNRSRVFVFGVLLCTAISFGFGANIKDISVYANAKERLDVLLKLDSAFNGELGSTTARNKKMTFLANINLAKSWSKSFANAPIKKLTLVSRNNNLYIDVESNKPYQFKPSISKDKNTIRLSYLSTESNITQNLLKTPTTIKPTSINNLLGESKQPQNTSHNPTTLDSIKGLLDGENMYYMVAFGAIVLVLFVGLYKLQKSSRFSGTIKIAAQNQLDSKNKIVIFETKDYFYMVLMGEKSNVLIDKIARNKLAEKRTKNATPLRSTSQTIGNDDTFNDDFWNSLTQGNLIKR